MDRPALAQPATRNRTQILAMFLIGGGLLVLGVLAAVLLLKNASANGQEQAGSYSSVVPVQVSFAAPQLNLKDLQGSPVSLVDYRDQIVLVNNWATWCPPCKAEMPTLQAYFQAHYRQKFSVIAIEAGEPVSEVSDFARQFGLSFPVWVDPESKALDAFQNDRLPSSYVIDRSGKVRLTWNGPINREMLEKYVTPLLKE